MSKWLILSIFSVFIFWLVFSYWLVVAWPLSKIETNFVLSNNFFTDSPKLSSNKIIIKSSDSADSFNFSWDCLVDWNLLSSDGFSHIFDVRFLDKNCNKEKIDLYIKTYYKTIKHSFNVINPYNLYEKYLDYSDEDLEKTLYWVEKSISDLNSKNTETPEQKSLNLRKIEELEYFKDFFSNIIEKRKQKYLIPVKWLSLPTRETKVPNSLRPYRKWYTDWIHHWWDFDSKKWSSVISLDDWIIIRVVNWFTASDFAKINRWDNLTEEDRLKNLDVLRWNQVWIKTMKWDVAFYSHLEEIFPEIKEWLILKRWQPIWTIWATWVPEEWYSDFHLHMAVQKNPQKTENAWKYSFLDVMAWPWYFKNKSASYVLEHQKEVFESN